MSDAVMKVEDSSPSSSEDEEQDSVDSEESSEESSDVENSRTEGEINPASVLSYSLVHVKATSLLKNYICQICGSKSMGQVAIASSDFSVSLYDCNLFRNISTFHGHSNTVSNIRYNPSDQHQIYSSSTDGSIRLWDTRKPGDCVSTLKDNQAQSGRLKPFLSFDLSKSGKFLCAGTELFEGDAYLDFWDTRSCKPLGAYWESHSDDITQVRFHPVSVDIVASASTDGLVNVFDLSKESEDDALLNSLNTQSSVDIISWHSVNGVYKGLTCITDTMDVQIWERDGTAPVSSFLRSDISKVIKTTTSDTYLINVHSSIDGDILLLAGASKKDGEFLSLLEVDEGHLMPKALLPGSNQLTRCSWYNEEEEYVVAGGESGFLCRWQFKNESTATPSIASQLKIIPKLSNARRKPYL